ncbi:unnamed protein product [Bursaphelenchus xylophilus]|uniref:(pine wood nematode) hypothetical protein n=1 Tax=Bursaphelenchus xylophilus TaxID=6326 RepID=A0A1I7RHD4_BURXY|nr:unnamed protein product [Bursaphelenchus xylophilus]CAG9115833.1 unnamed protein product [Bursaphelenchus xylophilus]
MNLLNCFFPKIQHEDTCYCVPSTSNYKAMPIYRDFILPTKRKESKETKLLQQRLDGEIRARQMDKAIFQQRIVNEWQSKNSLRKEIATLNTLNNKLVIYSKTLENENKLIRMKLRPSKLKTSKRVQFQPMVTVKYFDL